MRHEPSTPTSAVETRRVLVLSTAHLSPETIRSLNETPPASWAVSGGVLPFGYYVYAHDEAPEGVQADLMACLSFGRSNGFDYVQFDCDAEHLLPSTLQVFDH